jgi:hypothetical protein
MPQQLLKVAGDRSDEDFIINVTSIYLLVRIFVSRVRIMSLFNATRTP